MKKVIKKLSITFCIILLFFLLIILNRRQVINTEYGDSFTVIISLLDEEDFLKDNHSDFALPVYYNDKHDLTPICDDEYFRCYRFKNNKEDFFICKIKEMDVFFSVSMTDEEYAQYIIKINSKEIKSNFLTDSYLMEICLPYLDSLYHDEFIELAKKFVSKDFEGLDKYGLTNIEDETELTRKSKIMEEYLQKNRKVK